MERWAERKAVMIAGRHSINYIHHHVTKTCKNPGFLLCAKFELRSIDTIATRKCLRPLQGKT